MPHISLLRCGPYFPKELGFSPEANPRNHHTAQNLKHHSTGPFFGSMPIAGQSPSRGFSPLNLPYGLFALEGLAFWETPSPSNYHRFALLLIPAKRPHSTRRPPAKRSKFHSQPTSLQLSDSTNVRGIPQTERAYQQSAANQHHNGLVKSSNPNHHAGSAFHCSSLTAPGQRIRLKTQRLV